MFVKLHFSCILVMHVYRRINFVCSSLFYEKAIQYCTSTVLYVHYTVNMIFGGVAAAKVVEQSAELIPSI